MDGMLTRPPAAPHEPSPPVPRPAEATPATPTTVAHQAQPEAAEVGVSLRRRVLSPQTFFSFAIAVAVLWFVVRRLDLNPVAILGQIQRANPALFAVAFVFWYGSFFVRGWRWGRMIDSAGISQAGDQRIPRAPRMAEIILIAYFANSLVPAKLGDAYRSYLLKREIGVPFSAGLGTVLAERLVDAMMLVVVLAGSALVVFGRAMPTQASPALTLGALLFGAGLIGLGLMWLTRDTLARFLPPRIHEAYTRLHGAVFGSLRRPVLVFGIGLLLWFGDGMRVWFVARSLNAGISPAAAILVAVMGALLTVIPFTPAGLGVVELGVGSVLVGVIGLDPVLAGSIILLDRVVAYWSLLLVGGALYARRTRREYGSRAPAASATQPA
jgi:uncharacterized membrane protein YbhN (UPF0104 family)